MGDVKAAFDEWAATNDIDDLHALDIFARGWHADACRGVLLNRPGASIDLITALAAWYAAQEGGK